MIRFQSVSKKFGEIIALQRTDLSIAAGRTTALIGPSGCGKSTVLRLIVGLLRPTTGIIEIDGKPIDPSDWLQIRRRMGYVIQEGGLFPHLTARQNAALMARHLLWPDGQLQDRLEELCQLSRFPSRALERYPAELSGGQRQRVSLMRALMLKPEVLLLDEPLAALDPMVRSALQSDLKRIIQQLRITTLLVTHDMPEAAYLADQIVLLREGRIVQWGTLEELRDHPADPFVSEFISVQKKLTLL